MTIFKKDVTIFEKNNFIFSLFFWLISLLSYFIGKCNQSGDKMLETGTYTRKDGTFICYERYEPDDVHADVGLVYLHGLLSCRKCKKATFVKEFAIAHQMPYLVFDFTAHAGRKWQQKQAANSASRRAEHPVREAERERGSWYNTRFLRARQPR